MPCSMLKLLASWLSSPKTMPLIDHISHECPSSPITLTIDISSKDASELPLVSLGTLTSHDIPTNAPPPTQAAPAEPHHTLCIHSPVTTKKELPVAVPPKENSKKVVPTQKPLLLIPVGPVSQFFVQHRIFFFF
jgi:hypothetical protein